MCKVASWWKGAVYHGELSLVLCDDLGVCDGGVGGRLKREGIHVYV